MSLLNHVHRQRLRGAVLAHRAGNNVRFRICRGEPSTVVWGIGTGRQHVIASDFGSMDRWLSEIEAEFWRLLLDIQDETEPGYPA